MKVLQLILTGALVFSAGCLHEPEIVREPETDLTLFILTWQQFEKDYPLFVHKDIDWVETGDNYYPLAEQAETQEELLQIVADMVGELQDPALYIRTQDNDTIRTFQREYQSNVDMTVLMNNYLEPNGFVDEVGGFGYCDPSVLPYAYFDTLPDWQSSTLSYLDSFVQGCVDNNVPAVILDVRMNPSATPISSWYDNSVMGRFLDYSRVGAVYRERIGPEYYQYTDYRPAVDIAGPYQYTGPVYVLAGPGCRYAAEDFVANMENFPNVTVIGETTAGSNTRTNTLIVINADDERWSVKVGLTTLLTHDLQWVEGAGVEPDILVEATEDDFTAGVDPVLEYAMDLLEQY